MAGLKTDCDVTQTSAGQVPVDDKRIDGGDPAATLRRKAKRLRLTGARDKASYLLEAARILSSQRNQAGPSNGPEIGVGDPSKPSPPTLIALLFQVAVETNKLGDRQNAEVLYRAILALDATFAMVWSNLAALLVDDGRFDAAVAACREALDLVPDLLNAQLNLAKVYRCRNMPLEVVNILSAVVARHPRRFDLLGTLAEALVAADRLTDAIDVYDRVIVADPQDVVSMFARADLLKRLAKIDEAIVGFREVTRLQPDHAFALSNEGILTALHSVSNDLDHAANLCLRAATLEPNNAAILNNLGVVLQLRGDTENAVLVFKQLTVQDPTFAPAYSNIGSMLAQKGFYDEAEDAFLQALAIDPTLKEARIEMTKIRRHLCDWTQSEFDKQVVRELNGGDTNFLVAFMAMCASGEEQLDYARLAMNKFSVQRATVAPYRNTFGTERLRIGYLSGDFKEHPVGHLLPDLLTLHERERFEVIGYSIGADENSSLRRRLVRTFDRFVNLDKKSDLEAATTILEDGIDILVDLTGATANGRFGIMSLRPAPIQVSFLGLPGTSGSNCIDYIIADRFLVPPGHERFYQEKVVRLPHCYQPSDSGRRALAPPPSRSDCGLPEDGFVFASFNNAIKISPEVFDLWMRILAAVEGSVLWLFTRSTKAKANLVARAAACGITSDRLIFAGAVSYDIYLTRMICADLFLDTFPYAAGATCNDALWVGLPVLTCVGETYVSRMGGSLLTTLGMPELVTDTLADYERKAIEIASDPAVLRALNERMAAVRLSSTLFDMPRFTRSIERAYTEMARRARSGAAASTLDVGPEPDS